MRSLVCIGIVYTMVSDVASCGIAGVVLIAALYCDGFLDKRRTFLISDGLLIRASNRLLLLLGRCGGRLD